MFFFLHLICVASGFCSYGFPHIADWPFRRIPSSYIEERRTDSHGNRLGQLKCHESIILWPNFDLFLLFLRCWGSLMSELFYSDV